MIGPCLVLLLGGAPAGAPAKAAPDPVLQRLFHAVVITGDAGAYLAGDTDAALSEKEGDDLAVPLRKAEVVRMPDPTKER
jgi:hypothetical protein